MDKQEATLDPRLVLLYEHGRMMGLVMATTDAVEMNNGRVNFKVLKKALARQMRESESRRDQALRDLGLSDIPEALPDAIVQLNKGRIPYSHRENRIRRRPR